MVRGSWYGRTTQGQARLATNYLIKKCKWKCKSTTVVSKSDN